MATTQAGNVPVTQKATVARADMDFVDGVCSGYLTYYHEYQDKPLSDCDVYTFLAQNIFDVRGTDRFNAGYCTVGLKPYWKIGRRYSSTGGKYRWAIHRRMA